MSSDNDRDVPSLSPTKTPLIFISHDTRDAAIAEAFSKLLSSVSAGVLKSFRSSDKKGNQGIEYGVEWYPEIMKKLEASSDVVCLLTPNSVGRPWILYEARVAKGKLETPVHGVALGIPLQSASVGPFAQFQNSDDSEDALTQLVIQLVQRIPGSEPDREVVATQVDAFRQKILPIIDSSQKEANVAESADGADGASVAKLFEEVKVMFLDLPTRIERRFDPESSVIARRRRKGMRYVHEITAEFDREIQDGLGLLIIASQFKDDIPWLYDLSVEACKYIRIDDVRALSALKRLSRIVTLTFEHPAIRDSFLRSGEQYRDAEMLTEMLHRALAYTRDRVARKSHENAEAATKGWSEERLETLREMWARGHTASEIAGALGGVSRNAVIGKAHRLGLQSRPTPVTAEAEPEPE